MGFFGKSKPQVRTDQVNRLVMAFKEQSDADLNADPEASLMDNMAYQRASAAVASAQRNSSQEEIQRAVEIVRRTPPLRRADRRIWRKGY